MIKAPDTVNAHLDHLRKKACVHTTVQLIAWAARRGYLDEPDCEGQK